MKILKGYSSTISTIYTVPVLVRYISFLLPSHGTIVSLNRNLKNKIDPECFHSKNPDLDSFRSTKLVKTALTDRQQVNNTTSNTSKGREPYINVLYVVLVFLGCFQQQFCWYTLFRPIHIADKTRSCGVRRI